MRRTLAALPLTLCLSLVIAPAAPAAGRGQGVDFAELERVAVDELRERQTPGAAVAVVSGDRIVFAKGFGVASVESRAPVTPETLFRLGSTTKMLTGAALATLASRGRLDLRASISTYVKGLDPALGRVTTAQLLSHTAGMRDFAAPVVSNDESALGTALRPWKSDVLFTEPNAVYSYSSPGYWLAGLVLEEVGGKPYADLMSELVFEPLGMERSTLRPLVAMTYPMSVGHAAADDGTPAVVRPATNNTVMWPAGSVYTSASELARFAVAFLNGGRIDGGQAIAAEVIAELSKAHATMPGSDGEAFYSLGLIGYPQRGVRVLQHGGFSRGYGSMLTLVPEHRVAIVVVTNRSGETLRRTTAKAMELTLPLAADEAPASGAPLPPLDPRAFVGVYEHAPLSWEVVERAGRLFLVAEGKESGLTRVARYRFAVEGGGEIAFVPNADGRIEHVFFGLYSARRVR